jgi:hypothetical protein
MTTMQTDDTAGLGHGGHGPSVVIGEAVGEAVCGMTVIILATIGLAHADWEILASIATMIVGAAFVFEGVSAVARFAGPAGDAQRESHAVVSTECVGGVAGVILGVLAVLGIAPNTLVSVAVFIYGASLIVGSLASNRFHSLHTAAGSAGDASQFAPLLELTFAASGAQALVGLAATVLGIIALLDQNTHNLTLNLVGLLIVGAYLVLISAEVARRMMSFFPVRYHKP